MIKKRSAITQSLLSLETHSSYARARASHISILFSISKTHIIFKRIFNCIHPMKGHLNRFACVKNIQSSALLHHYPNYVNTKMKPHIVEKFRNYQKPESLDTDLGKDYLYLAVPTNGTLNDTSWTLEREPIVATTLPLLQPPCFRRASLQLKYCNGGPRHGCCHCKLCT
jgi:hypothetical protein